MAKINDLTKKIEGYDGMSAEEKLKAIEGLEFADEGAISKLKSDLSKANSESADYKKQLREKQTEAERKEAERKEQQDALQAELNALRKEKATSEYVAQFIGLGFDPTLARTNAEALVNGEYSTVFNGIKGFMESHDATVKANLLKQTPPPPAGNNNGNGEITKDQFDRMSYKEMTQLYNENPELYKQLSGDN